MAVAGAGVALEHSCADGGRGAGVKDICTHIHIYLYMYIYIYMLMVAEVLV